MNTRNGETEDSSIPSLFCAQEQQAQAQRTSEGNEEIGAKLLFDDPFGEEKREHQSAGRNDATTTSTTSNIANRVAIARATGSDANKKKQAHFHPSSLVLEPTPINVNGYQVVDKVSNVSFDDSVIQDLRALLLHSHQHSVPAGAYAASTAAAWNRDFGYSGLRHQSSPAMVTAATNPIASRTPTTYGSNNYATFAPSNSGSNIVGHFPAFHQEPPPNFATLCKTLDACAVVLSSEQRRHEMLLPTGCVVAGDNATCNPSFSSVRNTNKLQSSHVKEARHQHDSSASHTNSSKAKASTNPTYCKQWHAKFKQLLQFKEMHGHCNVPNVCNTDKALAHWIRRQRHQYKLKESNKHSTLSDERQAALNDMGFEWDPHTSVWEERYGELAKFKQNNGHCRVPRPFPNNPQLAIWVKCQRRQYQLFQEGQKTALTPERLNRLEGIGFTWTARSPGRPSIARAAILSSSSPSTSSTAHV